MIAGAVRHVRERVAVAAARAGRDPSEVTIVAASKYATVDEIRRAVASGIADVGENRAQDLRDKRHALGDQDVRWHFLGPIQTNKVRFLDGVRMLHSLDRPEEAEALQRRGDATGASWDALVEVNLGLEGSKEGIAPDGLPDLLGAVAAHARVRIRGLMIVAPQAVRPEDIRWVFARARALRDEHGLQELSMGMTDDFEVAVEEGSTMVRIGRAIFRPVATARYGSESG